jgi:hypothetical protein
MEDAWSWLTSGPPVRISILLGVVLVFSWLSSERQHRRMVKAIADEFKATLDRIDKHQDRLNRIEERIGL